MGNLNRSRLYFLPLLVIFFVLHGYMVHFPLVPVNDALKLAGVYILAAILIAALFYLFFRSRVKATLFAFFILCFQFFFGMTHDSFKAIFPGSFFSRYTFILPLVCIGIIAIFIFLLRTKKSFTRTTRYLNILLLVLILVDSGLLIRKLALQKKEPTNTVAVRTCDHCPKPNIYFIVLDEYASRESLQELFEFDNSEFEDELRKRNFFIASSPLSNYNYTPYSMASIFNMDYVKGITEKSNDIENRNTCLRLINENNLTKMLTTFGYEFVNLSMFDFAGIPNTVSANEFYSTRTKLITSQTLTGRIKKDLWYHFITTYKFKWAVNNYQNELIANLDYQLKATADVPEKTGGPRFVYTHLIMPHYPYLYDKDGNPQPLDKALYGGKTEYLAFLQYANKKSLSLIDEIISKDKTDPIILLISDHGFTKYDPALGKEFNFENIINVRMPESATNPFPDSVTNVNLFRYLMNTRFNQELPILKDSTIFLKEF